ncbi:MAG: alkaline phosphatase family protein [Acidobacteria bacterium]|nr:alkaline phosphatase family protein [Acidobacteriota bacterium]
MSEASRINAGPWCGAVTETGATIKLSVMRNVQRAEIIISEASDFHTFQSVNPFSIWVNPDYQYRILTFRLSNLRPNTQYFYNFRFDGRAAQEGTGGAFQTFPEPGTQTDFRFAFSSCSKSDWFFHSPAPEAYAAITQEPGLLFFAHLGDLYYDIHERDIPGRFKKYDSVLSRKEIKALFQKLPVVYGWDDHDFLGNNAEGDASDESRSARKTALEAYSIYVPHHEFASPSDGLFQSFQIGNVMFLLTDTRFNKTSRNSSGGTGKTILGRNQKLWLKNKLLEGKSKDLIIWANSVPWIGDPENGLDFWAGYAVERKELADFVKQNQINNVCMISGDAHMLAIDDGSHHTYTTPDSQGNQGGFPVFQAAALESPASEKGGDYSIGHEDGTAGGGIGERRQYGLFEVKYPRDQNGAVLGVPTVTWVGKRAKKSSSALSDVKEIIRYSFPSRPSYSKF